ncbi:molybdopterin-dependent oxidoreductase [Streptomyces sp. NPDC056231]|uniref:molybdopterin-dependent oxidoreductase n=1 Tax=Streptomyces sp. NPDC056231 TaxID=3345755 RepID=UPI003AAD19B9
MGFYSLPGDGPDGGLTYDVHPTEQMRDHLTMQAYDMNDVPLSSGHGAPLRLCMRSGSASSRSNGRLASNA